MVATTEEGLLQSRPCNKFGTDRYLIPNRQPLTNQSTSYKYNGGGEGHSRTRTDTVALTRVNPGSPQNSLTRHPLVPPDV